MAEQRARAREEARRTGQKIMSAIIDISENQVHPHRYPSCWWIGSSSWEIGKRVVGLKNVTVNRALLPRPFPAQPGDAGRADHRRRWPRPPPCWPSRPTARCPMTIRWFFASVDNVRFKRPVVPGDQLVMEGPDRPQDAQHLEVQGHCPRRWRSGHRSRIHVRDQAMSIHPTAIVHPGARIAEASGRRLFGDRRARGDRRAPASAARGRRRAHPHRPRQPDLPVLLHRLRAPGQKYAAEPTRLEIGDRNTIREFCSFSTGTVQDGGPDPRRQRQLDHGLRACGPRLHGRRQHHLRQQRHPGRPCHVGDWAILGGFHRRASVRRVGATASAASAPCCCRICRPSSPCPGNPAAPHGINSEASKRRGYSSEGIAAIKRAYKTSTAAACRWMKPARSPRRRRRPELQLFSDFIADSGRGIVR